ncbi:hypothetical protein EKN38_13065 [Enterobacter sp. WCHEn045836]|uniref:hypothetical protein n=1 Tax=Enterobacter sp. WCHEn045836 TaxID=2497434 RepID=UPI000F826D28|nr:hypothetical protein [Enterobacter sp. WCHEn045836]RTQ01299.1 hypothetical protein EKN38_13065 [Enterobacter sp. WCHEn045836]
MGKGTGIHIVLDTSRLEKKIAYLNLLLDEHGVLHQARGIATDRLIKDFVFTQCSAQEGKDGVLELKQTVDFGQNFNDVVASLLNVNR